MAVGNLGTNALAVEVNKAQRAVGAGTHDQIGVELVSGRKGSDLFAT